MQDCQWFKDKVRACEVYSQNLYAAICNNVFQKLDTWPILKNEIWHCSWRSAGGIVADLRNEGDYMDWYCSGIFGEGEHTSGRVEEGVITEEISVDLMQLGWKVTNDPR